MPQTYNPKDAQLCWPEGDYDAVLEKVEDGTSKASGSPMQTLYWTVYSPDGRQQTIKDYISFPKTLFKLKQLAIALGKRSEFDAGTFQADNEIGCNLTAELIVEEQDGFDDKNKIGKLKPRAGYAPSAQADQSKAGNAKEGRRDAWQKFNAKHSGKDADSIADMWKAAVLAYFPNRKPDLIAADEWKRFSADGFVRKAEPSPVSETPQFKDDDIPF